MPARTKRNVTLWFAIAALCLTPPLPTRAEGAHHVVHKGDTLTSIAELYNLRPRDIAVINGIGVNETLSIGQDLLLPSSGAPLPLYYVHKGDTLDSIADQFDTTVKDLVRRNRIADPNNLTIGQKIALPLSSGSPPGPPPASSTPPAPIRTPASTRDFSMVWAAVDLPAVAPGRWRYIVIHHSASVQGDPAAIDRYHRERRHMENGLAYHFVIGNGHGMPDGQIAIGNRWVRQIKGGHLASEDLNKISIGICLIGNFENGSPSKRQMESLRALVQHLMARCQLPVSSVRTHRQINTKPTECPGSHFPTRKFIASLQSR